MAKLRGGSTVGGNPIVSLDVMNDVIYQLTNIELASKMNKFEQDKITDFSKTDSYIKDKNKNGFWQIENATNTTLNNNGLLANLSNDNARFQLYASNKSNEESTLYFRTGWDNSIKDWRKVVTDTILEDGLNTKFDKTGGDISGSIEATNYISTNSYLRAKNSDNDYLKFNINSNKEGYYEASSNVTRHNFNKPINAKSSMTVDDNLVYHAGIFDYNDYAINNSKAATYSDVSRIVDSGNYYGTFTANSPVTDTICYLNVSSNNDGTNIIQRLYSTTGKAYFRVCNSGTWTKWFTMGGNLSYTRTIGENNWTSADDIYELIVTHNLGTDNITSVVVTDSDNISMFTGFKITSTSTIKIYSSTAVAGKVVINANQI